ncbi:MAG: hypothetical protein M3O22_07055 [Pseudomonadota bacterium]|nr:hypothetical protein [Pseudomonadota bacterium]
MSFEIWLKVPGDIPGVYGKPRKAECIVPNKETVRLVTQDDDIRFFLEKEARHTVSRASPGGGCTFEFSTEAFETAARRMGVGKKVLESCLARVRLGEVEDLPPGSFRIQTRHLGPEALRHLSGGMDSKYRPKIQKASGETRKMISGQWGEVWSGELPLLILVLQESGYPVTSLASLPEAAEEKPKVRVTCPQKPLRS